MKLADLVAAMEHIAPARLAESWDNVGLLAGDPAQPLSRVLLCIDYTAEVAAEGRDAGCDAVIAYHPPIFQAIKRLNAGSVVFDAMRRNVALYSPHTAWDGAPGGANDFLCDLLGAIDRRPLRAATPANARQCKLVTFVPERDVDRVAAALFDAGAGRIGNYSACSFRTPGHGTFFGDASTRPAVGEPGQLERVEEIRLETIVSHDRIAPVLAALVSAHPYEEPAFDLQQLLAAPIGAGSGLAGTLAEPAEREQLFARIRNGLQTPHLLIAGPRDGKVSRVAVCAGSGGELLADAIASAAGLYLTGELRHHDALKAAAAAMTVVCALHSNSERASLAAMEVRIKQLLPELAVLRSQRDRDPFEVI